MNVEQRLLQAFDEAARFEPSDDLWLRVVHSIDEDRRHRQRVVRLIAAIVGSLVAVGGSIVLSLDEGAIWRFVPWERLEVIETVVLVAVIAALGPAIRRFGRNYAGDLLHVDETTAPALLRLLDVAYWLVGSGYILVSTRLVADRPEALANQLGHMAERIGGLVLVLGLLHAVTLIVLPVIALVHNSTRLGHKLPRWVIVLLVLMGLALLLLLPNLIGVLIIAGQGG